MKPRETGTNAALHERCEAIRALLDQADVSEVASRYKVGAILAKLRDDTGTYGDRGIDRAATMLSKHRGTLYRYAAVADLGPWRELRVHATRKNRDGDLLSWSHWLELGRVPSEWRQWLERALTEAWSVRELHHRLDLAVGHRMPASDDGEDTTAGAFADSLRAAHRYDVEVTGAIGAVLDRLERLPSRERPREVPELLARGMDLMAAAREKSDQLFSRMLKLKTDTFRAKTTTAARES